MTDNTIDRMAAVAADLSFVADEETLRDCLDSYGLDASATPTFRDPLSPETLLSDDHNALLDTYDSPRTGAPDGPLSGISIAVKDNLAVAGLALTCGVAGINYDPPYDSLVARRLLDAGGEIVGKANMDAMATFYGAKGGQYSEFGPVSNPMFPNRVSGGSSSGSAAAVAAGLADAAIGTDTGGSIRHPATYCRLVGIKPTWGLVPRHGLVHLAPSLDTIGPIAKNVDTAAAVLEAISGHDRRQGDHGVGTYTGDVDDRSLRVGLPEQFFDVATDHVAAAVRAAIESVADQTEHTITSVSLANDAAKNHYKRISDPQFVWLAENSTAPYRSVGSTGDPATPYGPLSSLVANDVVWHDVIGGAAEQGFNRNVTLSKLSGAFEFVAADGRTSAVAYDDAEALNQRVSSVLNDVDVLVTPTMPEEPPRSDAPAETGKAEVRLSANTRVFNLTGMPAVTVPVGDDRPIGLQIVADRFADATAIGLARTVESVT